jgi:hypothetical protein
MAGQEASGESLDQSQQNPIKMQNQMARAQETHFQYVDFSNIKKV